MNKNEKQYSPLVRGLVRLGGLLGFIFCAFLFGYLIATRGNR